MKKIALVGNPNCGKTTVFNSLTGLNHKVGNFPGITVEKKEGIWNGQNDKYKVIDLPGTYSIYPKTPEEKVVQTYLKNERPDVVLIVLDSTNLKRNLLLLSQIADLELPLIAFFNMSDLAQNKGIEVDIENFVRTTSIQSFSGTARKYFNNKLESLIPKATKASFRFSELKDNSEIEIKKDTERRYEKIDKLLPQFVQTSNRISEKFNIDKILLHPFWGYVTFLFILFLIFQSLFYLSSYPMDLIDGSFASLQSWWLSSFGDGPFMKLIAEGVISGIGGVVIFIPQIAFLFFFLGLLEESGYMARAVFLMDKIMHKVGMNGRSVVPLISASACAIPAIMGARTIKSTKERLITIFVAPLISCSARLPVYAVLIAVLFANNNSDNGFFNTQGMALMALYLLGFLAAILTSIFMSKTMTDDQDSSLFALEIPEYRIPVIKNIFITVYSKTKSFIVGAGKIILAISVVLWVLASYGPKSFDNETNQAQSIDIEESFVGISGKVIEPVIKPLGYDWKIGIALITSFAAREVFVGTLSTIYSIDSEEEATIAEKIKTQKNHETGRIQFDKATCISLLLFYVFAMQCMSTLAVVRRETGSWKWPTIQFVYMTALAYLSALISYQILS